jgi:hypothetical protein
MKPDLNASDFGDLEGPAHDVQMVKDLRFVRSESPFLAMVTAFWVRAINQSNIWKPGATEEKRRYIWKMNRKSQNQTLFNE